LVQTLYDLERYDEAEVVIDEAFISHPDNENFLLLKAKILTERCDYTEALSLIERSLTLAPENLDMLEAKADVYFGTGDFDRAKRTYDEILKVDGLSDVKKAALYHNRALVLSNLNKNEEALQSLDQAAECYQQDSYWYQLKATILMDMGELKEASAVLEEATFLYPDAVALSELSVLSSSEGWWAGDTAELDAKSHDINQDIVLDVMMGDVGLLYEEGKYDQAISVINECLELSDDKLPFLDSKANVLFESGDYLAALKVYDEVIAILSENNERSESHHLGKESMLGALTGKTTALIYLKQFDDALSLIDAVLEENPKSIPILINKGICYEKMGRLQEAFSWFEKACFVDPRSVDAWTARGRVLEVLNENASALEAYVNAIRLDSTNLASRTNMIALLFKLKRYDDLLVHSDRALNIYPYDPSILNLRGRTLEILGRWEEASTCLERALEVSPENGELLFALGRILSQVNRDAEAFDRLMTAMKTLDDPSDVFSHVGHVLVRLGKCGAAVDILNTGLQEKPHQRDLIDKRDQALERLVVYSQTLA
jgi:tetratricopeptide (TPR) repeat protein